MAGPLWHTSLCLYFLQHGFYDVPDTHALYHGPTGRVSSLTAGELQIDMMNSVLAERNLRHAKDFLDRVIIEPYDDRAAEEYAETMMAVRRLTRRVEKADVMLVAQANALKTSIATRFPRALVRIPSANVLRCTFKAGSSPRLVAVPAIPFPRKAPGHSHRPAPGW
ncbi:MAG TPA: hypothetical protein VNW46_13095 [Gemmatimonadaceae bacterium]|jgi:predicted nucleic acid-binding protein|nr:hypothetical protein [Gemmatimonadaceae bacterium]